MHAESPSVPPVVKRVEVARAPDDAFRIFTREIDSWWPAATYSVSESAAATITFGAAPGEPIVETEPGGATHVWGTLLTWEPPRRIVFTWHPGRAAESAQEVELTFTPCDGGKRTRVHLEHRGWEILGDGATDIRNGYDHGWEAVLAEIFHDRCATGAPSGGSSAGSSEEIASNDSVETGT